MILLTVNEGLSEVTAEIADNVVSLDGVLYEMPRGYAKTRITVHRHVLDGHIHVLHEQRLVRLWPVDLAANAATAGQKVDHPVAGAGAHLVGYGGSVDTPRASCKGAAWQLLCWDYFLFFCGAGAEAPVCVPCDVSAQRSCRRTI